MPLTVSNNTYLFSNKGLNKSQKTLQTATDRLSSAKRINRAADDAAGLAIVAQLNSQILGSQSAYRNTNDGISLLQTAQGALSEINNITQRIRELSIQAANGTLNDDSRAALQAEVGQLQQQVSQIFASTEFNGQPLFSNPGSINIQSGDDPANQLTISTSDLYSQFSDNGFFSVDISTANGAETAISALDASLDTLNRNRSEFGATANRLESVGRSQQIENESLTASRSRIEDADYAAELAQQTSSLILQNAGLANLSQASVSSQMVSQLLK